MTLDVLLRSLPWFLRWVLLQVFYFHPHDCKATCNIWPWSTIWSLILSWDKRRSKLHGCKTKCNHIPDALNQLKMRCLRELEMRCLLFALQLPPTSALVLFVSIQTHRLHLKRYSDLYQTKKEIQLTRDAKIKLTRNKNTYSFICTSLTEQMNYSTALLKRLLWL